VGFKGLGEKDNIALRMRCSTSELGWLSNRLRVCGQVGKIVKGWRGDVKTEVSLCEIPHTGWTKLWQYEFKSGTKSWGRLTPAHRRWNTGKWVV